MYILFRPFAYVGVLFLFSVVFLSCKPKVDEKTFTLLAPDITNISFSNHLVSDFDHNILDYNYFYNGGGVAAADFNNDGLPDLYFTGNMVSSKLYLNKGNFSFQDVTEKASVTTINWATGIAVADINNDGLLDIYISYAGYQEPHKRTHQLFIHKGIDKEGIPHFTDEALAYGLADTSYTTQALFLDYDIDGDLDLFLANHSQDSSNPNYPKQKSSNGTSESNNKLFRNDGNRFTDVSKLAGILEEGYSLGVALSDINQDGWPDLYVSNDFVYDDALYINNRDGTFTERIKEYIQHTSRFSMGCDIADFNNDLYPDIISADMLPDDNERQKLMNPNMSNDRYNLTLQLGYLPQYSRNMLQLNNGPDANGKYSFSEIGQLAGIHKTDWSWSTLFADFDNDGWKDIFISNGIPHDITNNDFITYFNEEIMPDKRVYEEVKPKMLSQIDKLELVDKPDFIFRNNKDLTFSDQTDSWGLNKRNIANGAAYVDLDNDGDLDLVTNNLNEAASVYKNKSEQTSQNNFLRIKLNGNFAIGATIRLSCKGKSQIIEHNTSRGFQSSQDPINHFGLGRDSLVDTLKVIWLDGKQQIMTNVKANQLIQLNYADSQPVARQTQLKPPVSPALFKDITTQSGINFTHHQNNFEDFNLEPLLPHRFSRNGPYMTAGDVDGNGLEDFWVGGSAKVVGKLFLQQQNGKFVSRDMPDPGYEDMGGVFFDADGDKDLDIFIVSGGNVYNLLTAPYQDRIYFNDGKGNFTKDDSSTPIEYVSGSCVAANDFDKDGDVDLVVGGRVVPSRYPSIPQSFLLKNNGKGKFEDATLTTCPALRNIGMITSALWTDFNNDGWMDLMVVGEWMPITFFKNNHGILESVDGNSEMKESTGWWNSIAQGDFDNDGDIDYVAGNLGLNNYYKVSKKYPISVYAKDFDGNGMIEPILSYYLNGTEYTVANRDQITSVMPSIKKKLDSYSKFSVSDFNGIFSQEDLKGALILKANTFASVYIENKGSDTFEFYPLPMKAQFSSIRSIIAKDFNSDGNLDVLVSGNSYNSDFMTGRYDASIGLLLTGNGKGSFSTLAPSQSGISIQGDARCLIELNLKNSKSVISAVNEGKVQVFQLMK